MLTDQVAEETVMEPQQVEFWVLLVPTPHPAQERPKTQLVSSLMTIILKFIG
jgi:hypothetical protein